MGVLVELLSIIGYTMMNFVMLMYIFSSIEMKLNQYLSKLLRELPFLYPVFKLRTYTFSFLYTAHMPTC